MSVKKLDQKYLARDGAPHNIEIVKTDGCYLVAKDGQKYLDFAVGWCVGNLGWGNEEIKKTIRNYRGPDYVSPAFLYEPWTQLAQLLADITPGKLVKSFRATGGTEAVEFALRSANVYTKRDKYISIAGAYHGNSIGAMSVGSAEFRANHPGLLFSTHKIKPPLNAQTLSKVETLLKKKDIAALIMEPILLNLGVEIPEPEFMQGIDILCKKYGTLLIMDEVATGFNRTGKMFASEYYDITPDMIILGKAITGGYAPLAALVTTHEIAKAMEFESSAYSTFGWHPLSVAVALTNIKYMLKHEKKLQHNLKVVSEYFRDRLSVMSFKQFAEINIAGLAIGVKFKSGNYAHKIVVKAQKKGLLLPFHNDRQFTIFPPINITMATAKEGLDILEQSL